MVTHSWRPLPRVDDRLVRVMGGWVSSADMPATPIVEEAKRRANH